jgi:uncharacterized membrane protein YgcG
MITIMIISNTDIWWDLADAVVNHKMWGFLDHVKNYQLLSVSDEWSGGGGGGGTGGGGGGGGNSSAPSILPD